MKKSWIFLMSLILALGLCLTSCGDEKPSGDQNQNDNNQNSHTHSYSEWKVTEHPTCAQNGTEVRYCDCGEKQTEIIPATGIHTEVIDKAVAASCTESGLTEGKHCSVCELVIVGQEVVPATGHTEVVDEAVAPSCTENGLTEGKHCSVCNEVLVKQGVDPIIPHTYTDKYDESCNVCGNIRDAECAHSEIEIIKGYSATCTEPGLTDGEKCKKCGEIFLQPTVINATGHTEVIDEAVPATCTETGLTEGKHCSVCNEIIVKQEVIPPLDHVFATNYSFDNSFHWYSCTGCDAIKDKAVHQPTDDSMCAVCNQPIDTVGVVYDISDDGNYALVVGYTGTATKIRIADSYQGLPVTTIYEKAFYNINTITSVIIPDSVTAIGNSAFLYCSKLTSVVIGDSVTTIGESAFYDCSSLTSVVIPDSVTYIGDYAFYECYNLTSVVIGDSVTTIGYSAFSSCSKLTSVVIGDSVTDFGRDVFSYTKVQFNEYENCKYLGSGDNPYCYLIEVTTKNLSSYKIHEDTKIITGSTFSACSSLTSVVIPDSVTTIGDYAFDSCSSLTSVVIGDSVTTIGNSAFYDCSNLTSVVIPDSVTTIGYDAFNSCSSLTSVVIGDSVTTIGNSAFGACFNLKDVYYTGSEEEWKTISIGSFNSNLTGATIHYNYIPE